MPPLQAKEHKYVGSQKQPGGIVIRDMEVEAAGASSAAAEGKGKGKAAVGAAATDPDDKQMEADEDFARQLQAKMDAEMRAK